jgi:hypothetical protein
MPSLQLRAALATTAVAGLLTALSAGHAMADGDSTVPECVHHHSDWRYTSVVNDCAVTVDVTVEYTDGQTVPCRTVAPGAWATFPGYGTTSNYVTGLRACTPAS